MTGAVWYAILLYIFGMAIVVYYRPAIMFKPSGTWKEFGLTEGYTIFPFWMFVLVWSILSYALVTMGSVFVSTVVAKSQEMLPQMPQMFQQSVNTNMGSVATPISQVPMMNTMGNVATAAFAPIAANMAMNTTMNTSTNASMNMRLPGYYILENLPEGPKYVYWGSEPPTEKNVIVRQYMPGQ